MMWTQHSREKPAKPGWTIATMAIALSVTIALAQMQVSSRAPVQWKAATKVRLEDCPIVFSLPDVLQWTRTSDGSNPTESPIETTYTGSRDNEIVGRISFFHGSKTNRIIASHLDGIRSIDRSPTEYPITIAEENGSLIAFSRQSGTRHFAWCFVDRLDGSATSIFIETDESKRFAIKMADWICRSAQSKD